MQTHNQLNSQRLAFVLLIAAFAILHLSLEMLTGGVRTHYPLMREDMPALSNWWGLLILPLFGWIAHYFATKENSGAGILGLNKVVFYRLACGFSYGALIAAGFELGLGQMPLYLLLGLLLGGIVYPLYRGELMLGLVMGMTYTFGAVIPTVLTGLLAMVSLITHNTGRFVVARLRPVRP